MLLHKCSALLNSVGQRGAWRLPFARSSSPGRNAGERFEDQTLDAHITIGNQCCSSRQKIDECDYVSPGVSEMD